MTQHFRFDLLKEMPWRWFIFWILVPHSAVIIMWPVGGPTMTIPIFVCSIIALIVSQQSNNLLKGAALLVMLTFLSATYLTSSFNIALINIIHVDQYLTNLDIFRSVDYLVAAVVLIAGFGVALRYGSRTQKFRSKNQYLLAVASILLLINADIYASSDTRGSYKANAPEGEPLDSAISQNGIHPERIAARNLIVIIVESWGVPSNEMDRKINDAIWNTTELNNLYLVRQGTSKYFGSTTNAELREWCGVWADHLSFDFASAKCLPQEFRGAGFKTAAFHSFNGQFFEREKWYPKLGFDEQTFDRGLFENGANACEGLFSGACDADVPAIIAEHLRSSKTERNLVYWLTLNAHLPIAPDPEMGTDTCSLGTQTWREDFQVLCQSYTIHKLVADAVFKEIMAEDFPESDILIVGDHMPPFFPRAIRTCFDAERVPWIYLQNRAALEAARQ